MMKNSKGRRLLETFKLFVEPDLLMEEIFLLHLFWFVSLNQLIKSLYNTGSAIYNSTSMYGRFV